MGALKSDERDFNPHGLRFIGQMIFRDMTAPKTPHGLSMEPAHWILSQNFHGRHRPFKVWSGPAVRKWKGVFYGCHWEDTFKYC